ncbi:MAG TPA: hypothetical protein VHW45_02130, partial [Candidatus Sulfotelmatobacter sp.]|nr:hypothetical protein [Candidatus Sulfotelmatobacter sp.]
MLSTSVTHFLVTSDLDAALDPSLQSPAVPNAAISPAATSLLEWLALLLTPGLGPTKSRKLVGHFGSAERVFHA